MKAYEIREILKFKDVTNKDGKVLPNYPHLDDMPLSNKYIEKFNKKHGQLCLDGKIFHNMVQFGQLNYQQKVDDSVDKVSKSAKIVEAEDPFAEE